jgi:hypothetical protein
VEKVLITVVLVLLPFANSIGQNNHPESVRIDSQTSAAIKNNRMNNNLFIEKSKNSKERLDSTIFIWFNNLMQNDSSSTKTTYEYDIKGNITLEMRFHFDTLNRQWINVSKTENFYKEYRLDTLTLYYDWDGDSHSLVNNRKIKSVYDANNRLITKMEFALMEGVWNYGEEVHYYDENGNDTCTIGVNPYDQMERKTICTYDVNGKLLTQISQIHYFPHWVNSSKHQFTYNIYGDQTLRETFIWNRHNTKWIEKSEDITYYDIDRNDTCEMNFGAWDTVSNSWTEIFKNVSTYDSFGNRTSWANSRWDYDHWFTPGKIDYFFDERNNEILSIWYAYDPIIDWIYDVKYESVFDENDNKISQIGYKLNLDQWLYRDKTYYYYFNKVDPIIVWNKPDDIVYGALLSEIQLNASSNIEGSFTYSPGIGTKLDIGDNQELKADFVPDDLSNYNAVSKSVTINVVVGLETDQLQNSTVLKIYPNPVKNKLYIEYFNNQPIIFQITDITGQLVMSKQLLNSNFVDVSSLSRGLYLIRFDVGDKFQTYKVIVE